MEAVRGEHGSLVLKSVGLSMSTKQLSALSMSTKREHTCRQTRHAQSCHNVLLQEMVPQRCTPHTERADCL